MGIINDFLQYRKYKQENKKLVGLTEEVREEYTSNNKEQSVKKAIELIEENPDIAKGLLKKMIVDPEIPNQIIAEATQEIIRNSDETAGKIAGIEAVADIGEYVKDDTLSSIATEAGKTPEINRGLEINVVKQIDDKEKKQKGVEEILTRIYKNIARNKLDSKLFYEVDELRFVEPSDKIEELEQKIVAKQMALRCLEYGNPMISENPQNPLNRIIPIEKMLEIDIPTLIDKEYKEVSQDFRNEIKESKGKVYKYDKGIVRQQLIDAIQRQTNRNGEKENKKLNNIVSMAKVLPTKERETFIKNAEYIMVDKGARKAYEKFTEIVDDIKDLPEEEIEKSMMEFKDIIENKKGQLNGNRDEAQEEEEI